jgi:hypothetical protein
MPAHTFRSVLRENAWQLAMYALGMILIGQVNWVFALMYLAYGLFSNVIYMAVVCPYCGHYGLGTCKAGFHILSGGRFRPRPNRTFVKQFPFGAAAVSLGWFLPPLAAAYLLLRDFSWLTVILFGAFCIVSFWLLPQDSQRHCAECEMVDCPRFPRKQSV